jgi:hypothetical protein
MDKQARRYHTTPSALIGLEAGSWAAMLVDTACRLSGLAEFDVMVENAKQQKAMVFPTLPMMGGL